MLHRLCLAQEMLLGSIVVASDCLNLVCLIMGHSQTAAEVDMWLEEIRIGLASLSKAEVC